MQKQDQTFKNRPVALSELEKEQMMVDDLCGRLISEIEAVFRGRGMKFNAKYSKYLLVEGAGERNNLLNIETNLLTIHALCSPKKKSFFEMFGKEKESPVVPDDDKAYISELAGCAQMLNQNDPARLVTIHALNCLHKCKMATLPEGLSELIIETGNRKKLVEEKVKNNQYDILRLNYETDYIGNKIERKFEDPNVQRSNGRIPSEPLFDYRTDAPPKKYKGDQDPSGS